MKVCREAVKQGVIPGKYQRFTSQKHSLYSLISVAVGVSQCGQKTTIVMEEPAQQESPPDILHERCFWYQGDRVIT